MSDSKKEQSPPPYEEPEKMDLDEDSSSRGSGSLKRKDSRKLDSALDEKDGAVPSDEPVTSKPRKLIDQGSISIADFSEASGSQRRRSFAKSPLLRLKYEVTGGSGEESPLSNMSPTLSTKSRTDSLSSISSQCSALSGDLDESKRKILKRFTHRRPKLQRTSSEEEPDMRWINPSLLTGYPNFAPTYTHRLSLLIQDYQCFELSTRKVPTEERLRKNLGVYVQFQSKRCSVKGCTPCSYEECKACPHLFTCDCKAKFNNTSWCAHIHIMYMMQMSVFENQACLFINPVEKPMEMRHLRAFVMGKKAMVAVEANVYVEFFDDLRHSIRYRVEVLSEPKCQMTCKKCKLCGACYCHYECKCMDYWKYKHVCEHCHVVAMLRHDRRDELFAKYEGLEQDFSDSEYETDTAARYRIEKEHEESFKIQVSKIEEVAPTRWRVPSDDGDSVNKRTVFMDSRRANLCVCKTLSRSTCCLQCRICKHHYGCTCPRSDETICRHVHALARLLETPHTESDDEYYRRIVEADEEQFAMKDVILREPVEPIIGLSNPPVDIQKNLQ